ncbi:MAG: cupin domain-containing protein [Alistipes sp.]|nr:cupin domain-containing protein [Candidatus Alistipes equi]
MIIDFNSMDVVTIDNFKGGLKQIRTQMFFDGVNRIMHGTLEAGASIGEHTHEINSEVIFILSGKGTIIEDGEAKPIVAGQCTYCPKGHRHSLVNSSSEDLDFYCVVANQ